MTAWVEARRDGGEVIQFAGKGAAKFLYVHGEHIEDSPEGFVPDGLVKLIGPGPFARYYEVERRDELAFRESLPDPTTGVWPVFYVAAVAERSVG